MLDLHFIVLLISYESLIPLESLLKPMKRIGRKRSDPNYRRFEKEISRPSLMLSKQVTLPRCTLFN